MSEIKSRTTVQRKRLWEVDQDFLCATIGSCLTRSELHRLAKEKIFKQGYKPDDYELHSYFIRVAKKHDNQGKALHRYFEKKYRQATRKYFLTSDQAEIDRLWRQDLAEGNLDSGWWAIATHPALSLEAISAYYRQLHMLSHEAIAGYQQRLRSERQLRKTVDRLEDQLAGDRSARVAENKALAQERAVARSNAVRLRELETENLSLQHQLSAQAASFATEGGYDRGQGAGKLTLLQKKLETALAKNTRVMDRLAEIEEQQRSWLLLHEEQAREIAALESLLCQHVEEGDDPCRNCEEHGCGTCPGPDLCGRTVLYVGGRDRMIPHFRKLVEALGGRFLHHDGGKEESRSLLPKMLSTADAVFCPVDCISHDACNCVKKLCKRQRKRFVMMRNASLSALAKGLTEIVQ